MYIHNYSKPNSEQKQIQQVSHPEFKGPSAELCQRFALCTGREVCF